MLIDLRDIYNTYFQKPYQVSKTDTAAEVAEYKNIASKYKNVTQDQVFNGIPVSKISEITGREVFLPVELRSANGKNVTVDCATIRITYKNTIVRTPLSERRGTVKEQYSGGDYVFTIKGVLISINRKMPDVDIDLLKDIATNEAQVTLNNALAEIFMPGSNNVSVESLEFPEQEGKNIRMKPFVLVCETDVIETLEVK